MEFYWVYKFSSSGAKKSLKDEAFDYKANIVLCVCIVYELGFCVLEI